MACVSYIVIFEYIFYKSVDLPLFANLISVLCGFACGSQPIERMVDFVKELAEDPVSFAGKALTQPAAPSVGRVIFVQYLHLGLGT